MAATAIALSPAWAEDVSGDFDFYVLSLSWSPAYCAGSDDPNEDQCSVPRGFVAHGLWPQFEHGYPEFCRSDRPRWLDQRIIFANRDLFPSGGLAIHQWRKHGMCSGLGQEDYFNLTRLAYERVAIPSGLAVGSDGGTAHPGSIERLFVDANEGLSTEGMSVQCRRGELTEVRICMTRGLEFRSCAEVNADTCESGQIDILAAD